MKLVHLAGGLQGVRQLAGARADAALRKLGHLPPITYPHAGNAKPWTDEEYDEAIIMRLRGMSHEQIGAKLGRTKVAIDRQLGPERAE